ncbi:MAG: hypothetical protein QM809_02225 [Gordonia sp. (in: high G+C Gram-positive bacteria)]
MKPTDEHPPPTRVETAEDGAVVYRMPDGTEMTIPLAPTPRDE